MTGPIPGTEDVEGREFMYIEELIGQDFSQLMDDIFVSSSLEPMPKSGGILEEKVHITPPGDNPFMGVSFKGDLAGWRHGIVCYCKERGRKWATLRDHVLLVSDGSQILLTECKVEFEK
jgi:hypothetical protein